jgi:hypothetical protein
MQSDIRLGSFGVLTSALDIPWSTFFKESVGGYIYRHARAHRYELLFIERDCLILFLERVIYCVHRALFSTGMKLDECFALQGCQIRSEK